MIVTGSSPAPPTALQRFQLRGGLPHIDVDLVDLLHHRHGLGIGHVDQCAFGHQRLVDATGNRCADRRMAQVELATRQDCACLVHGGTGLFVLGAGVVAMLLADRLRGGNACRRCD